MIESTAQNIRDHGLISGGDRVLCMVSGGADSVAMLDILWRLSSGTYHSFPHTFSMGVCHINYGRRGQESDDDEVFVRRKADELGLPVHVIQAPREKRPNFQAWARDFRYLAAQNLCRWQGYTRIGVAHNKDDRIETFLYRLMTYSGRRSLVVMPPRRGRLIRPLLFATSAEVRGFCVESGLSYREDASNLSLDYTRNRIRQLLIPPLAEIRPDFRERITDTLCLLEDEDEVLETITERAWLEIAETDNESGEVTISVSALCEQPRATARLLIRKWLSGGTVRLRLSRRLLDSILSLCRQPGGTSSISLPDGLRVERRYDRLMLVSPSDPLERRSSGMPAEEAALARDSGVAEAQSEQEQGPAAQKQKNEAPAEMTLSVPGTAVFGGYEIEAVESPGWELKTDDPMRITIDAGRLSLPLRVRSWRPGDRFTPLGLGGSKSIQDLFTDAKVPRPERDRIPIVISGDTIAWVCGYRLSEDFKVTDFTRRTVGLKATRRAVERAV